MNYRFEYVEDSRWTLDDAIEFVDVEVYDMAEEGWEVTNINFELIEQTTYSAYKISIKFRKPV